MKITFKESKDSENTILVFNPNSVKIAHVNSKTRKVSICGNAVTKQLERINGLERTKATILEHFDKWVYENSPFRKLSKEQLISLQNNLIALNLVSSVLDGIVDEIKDINNIVNMDIESIDYLREAIAKTNTSSVDVFGSDLAIESFDMGDNIRESLLECANKIRIKKMEVIK